MMCRLFVGSVNYQIQEQLQCGQVNGVLSPEYVTAYHRCNLLL